MKKLLRFFMLAVLFLPFALHAQTMYLTVADSTATNSYVPVYGSYMDDPLGCQSIYPAEMLTSMVGENILSLHYYASSGNSTNWGSKPMLVKLMIVTESDLSAGYIDITNATTVYNGTISAGDATVENGFTVDFTTPFMYTGGNLLVSFQINPNDEGGFSSISWYGKVLTAASRSGYGSTNYDFTASGTVRNFLPKTTFMYGAAPTCFKVTGQTIDNAQTTANSLTLTWTDAINTTATYNIYDMSDTSLVASGVTGTTYTVNNLSANTAYSFGIQTDCGGGDIANGYAIASGRTACAAIATLPFNEDFETVPSGSYQMPYCWNRYTSAFTTTATYPYSYASNPHGGSRALYFYGNTGTAYPDTMVAILPELDVTLYPMSNNRVTFWAKMGAASNSKDVYVGTMTDPDDISTFSLVESKTVSGNTYTKFSVPMVNATGAYVALVVFKGTGTMYIDDVTLEEMPSCLEITGLSVSGATSSSITLSWTDDANTGASYTIYDMSDTSVVATVSSLTYTIDNLTANTNYVFGVQANCAAGDAPFTTISATTTCAPEALPFSEDFSASLSSNQCWRGATGTTADEVLAGSTLTLTANNQWTYSSSESNGLAAGHYRVNIYGSSCKKWMITPEIDLTNATSPLLSFDAAFTVYTSGSSGPATGFESNTSQAFMILVSTNNGQTWTTASDISLSSIASATYLTQYVDLSSYAGQTVRIAFYAQSTTSGGDNNLHVDNILIEESTGELCLPVTNLAATNITSDAATLTWTGDASSYNVYDMSDTSLVTTVSTASYDLTNLTAMTQYSYGISANCSSSESPIVAVTFATACTAVNAPFTETFEANSATVSCWTTEGSGSWTIGTGDYSASTGAFEGSLNAKITHGTTNAVTKLISPVIDNIDNGMILDFAYVLRAWGSDIDELRVYSRSAAESAWQQVAEFTNATEVWTVESVIVPGTVYQIAFEYTDSYGYGLGIDSVVFTAMTGSYCYPISNLAVSNVTTDGVTLTWSDENNSGVTYTVYDMSDTSVIVSNLTATTYDVTNLTPATYYNFGVVVNCSATEASDLVTVGVSTSCVAIAIPFVEDFEQTSSTLGCWSLANTDNNTGLTTTTPYSGSMAFVFAYNDNPPQYLISPELSGTENGVTISFMYKIQSTYYPESFQIGYSTTTSDLASFTWGTEQTNLLNTTYEEYSENLPAGTKYVSIKYTSNDMYYLFIDSLSFSMPPACLPATALTVDAASETSITISWTGTAASYDVYNGLTFVANVTTNSYTFTGLTAATSYVFGVQAICSATDSATVAIITATTECSTAAINLPYSENFSITSSTRNCWTSIDADNDGFGWTTQTDYTGAEQEALLSYSYDNGTYTALTPDNWAISPKLHSTAGSTVTMQWTVASAPSYPAEHYGVYVSTTTTDITAFTMVNEWTISNGSAEVKTLDLSAYAGQDIYVAFRHHNCTDQYVLKIDDVQLYEGAFVPDTLTVTFAVNDPVMGTTNPAPGTYQYVTGDTIHFSAIANPGYHFVGWEWALSAGVDTLGANYMNASLTLSAAIVSYGTMTFTALFEAGLPDSTTITYAVNDPAMGTINPAPGTYTIYVGDDITATATPNAGYVLSSWMLDIYIGTTLISSDTILSTDTTFANPMHFGVLPQTFADYNATITITAVFEASSGPVTQYTVTLNTADATMGSVSPAGANTVNAGSTFTATATANTGYQFVAWMSGDTQVSQANPYTFTVNGDITLTATFTSGSVEPCDVPTGLHTTDIQNESISIAWDANPNVSSWNIRYSTQGGDWTTVVANTNSYTISGLAQNTTYTMQVQANCGDGNLSDWSAPVTQTTTGLNNYLENSVVLFPNPAREYVDIRTDGDVNVKSMEVYDVYGKLINTVNVIENPTRINVSGLANGMYFVRVTTEQGVVTKSFIKK